MRFPFKGFGWKDCLLAERRWRVCLREESVCCGCAEKTEEYEWVIKTSTRHQAASEEERRGGEEEERVKEKARRWGETKGGWGHCCGIAGFCTFRTCQVNNRALSGPIRPRPPPSAESRHNRLPFRQLI